MPFSDREPGTWVVVQTNLEGKIVRIGDRFVDGQAALDWAQEQKLHIYLVSQQTRCVYTEQ